ncbi:MAG: methionine--tRNA ligase [Patescibacteria group bacterium]|nr:methionine--tRNA ligase [Patescibacteria group bacterium]
MNKFFISTAIYYVNANPHIGHALEIVQTDVLARYYRTLGKEVLFLTGTDENSLKNAQAAEKINVPVQDFVDKNAQIFKELKKILNLSFDDFIRTTEERHIKGAEKLWLACKKDIYKKKYKGLYCVGCEEFYTEKELVNGLCPEHKKKPELIEEENYFFKLSKYQSQLKELIEKDEIKIIPQTRKNEVLSFINSGLKDICISRSKERAHGWGIPVPGDESQIIWVWFDALANYITALGYGTDEQKFNDWWQNNNNKLHVIGKGILRFHAVYWPGMLLSAGISLPERIFVHEYINVDGQKMSKSLGNVIDPYQLVEKYNTEAVRYFLLREISPFKDGDFSQKRFEERYDADLAKGLGNLLARVLSLAEKIGLKNESFIVEKIKESNFQSKIDKTQQNYHRALKEFKFNDALTSIWELISFCDECIEKEKLWNKSENQKTNILYLLYTIGNIANLLKPFLPETSEKILKQIGLKEKEREWIFNIKKGESLFPKLNSF